MSARLPARQRGSVTWVAGFVSARLCRSSCGRGQPHSERLARAHLSFCRGNLPGLALKHRGAMPDSSRWSQRSHDHRKTAQKVAPRSGVPENDVLTMISAISPGWEIIFRAIAVVSLHSTGGFRLATLQVATTAGRELTKPENAPDGRGLAKVLGIVTVPTASLPNVKSRSCV